jgi:DNA-binding response OmpR family regulator
MSDEIIKTPILIVDDDPHVLISAVVTLESAGYQVITAESGKACIEILRPGFSGILLLDVMMPDMDGWDTIRAIKDERLDTHILIAMLTAKMYPDEKMVGLEDYVFDYITKPFDPDELIDRVNKYSEYL